MYIVCYHLPVRLSRDAETANDSWRLYNSRTGGVRTGDASVLVESLSESGLESLCWNCHTSKSDWKLFPSRENETSIDTVVGSQARRGDVQVVGAGPGVSSLARDSEFGKVKVKTLSLHLWDARARVSSPR